MNKKRLVLALLAPLAFLPVVAQAQPPGAYSTREGSAQQGYYDHTGTWHANQPNPYPDGYFDSGGRRHAYADERQGYYDRNGNWVPSSTTAQPRGGYYDRNGNWVPAPQQQASGYYDRNGNWVPTQPQQVSGYYDRNGNWVPTQPQQGSGYYDRDGRWVPTQQQQNSGYYDRNGRWVPYQQQQQQTGGYYDQSGRWHAYGSDTYRNQQGPQRWTYSEKGHAESLDVAARNFALTTGNLAREAARHSAYGDRVAVDTLNRLAQQASAFARVANQRNRADVVGSNYAQLVSAYMAAEQGFGALQPDAWLVNQFHVLASAMGRLDKRYFGNRAFNGQNPGRGAYGYGNSQYYPNGNGQYPNGRGY